MEQQKNEYIACWVDVDGGRVMRRVHVNDIKDAKKTVTAFRAQRNGESIECLPEQETEGLERILLGETMVVPFPS